MQIISSLLLISSHLILIQSQLQKPGRFRNLINTDLKKSAERNRIKEYILPEQDNAKLLYKVEAEEASDPNRMPKKQINKQDGTEEISFGNKLPKTQPFTFGKAIDLQINMTQPGEGEWIINEETQTKMWRFKVSSKEAHSMSIHFADFHLSPLSELYILGREVQSINTDDNIDILNTLYYLLYISRKLFVLSQLKIITKTIELLQLHRLLVIF